MKIVLGCTRIVFVFSQVVIKLPRIRLIRPIQRFFEHRANKQVENKLHEFGNNYVIAVFRYFFSGFYANQLEHRYSKQHCSEGIVPARTFLWGLILIQKKGKVVADSDPEWIELLKAIKTMGIAEKDTVRSCNFCVIDNRISMLDYGCKETIKALEKINLKIIERFGII